MNIAIIGAGSLGLCIAKGLIVNDTITTLYLTRRHTENIKLWEKHRGVIVTSDNKEVVKKSDILIFSTQPGQLGVALEDVKAFLTEKHVIIFTAAGFQIDSIEQRIGSRHHIIRAMPNTAISIGNSLTCICSNKKGKSKLNLAKDIFDKLGTTIEINEDLMRSATVVGASGIAFWMRLIRATSQGAVQLGFESDEALKIATHTCLGAAKLLIETGNHPEEEIDKVTTPRGCTIEGLNEMEHQGMSSALIKGLKASYNRIGILLKD